jgi:hypothetical protein
MDIIVIIKYNTIIFPSHFLFCPHAGQRHLLFSEKSKQKLSPALFAINGSAFISSSPPQMPRAN